jgi:hypothetical protein
MVHRSDRACTCDSDLHAKRSANQHPIPDLNIKFDWWADDCHLGHADAAPNFLIQRFGCLVFRLESVLKFCHSVELEAFEYLRDSVAEKFQLGHSLFIFVLVVPLCLPTTCQHFNVVHLASDA